MKKRMCLACILGVLLFICGIFALSQDRMMQFKIDGKPFSVVLTIQNNEEEILPWYDEEKGLYYFFLPSFITNRKLCFDKTCEDVKVNGLEMKKWNHLHWEQGEIYSVKINDTAYQVTFMKSENIPAFFMKTDSGNTDYIYADKHNEEKGQLMAVGADKALQYNGSLSKISLRGNTTVMQSKKPYGIKLDKSAALCGMNSGKSWKLLALYFEQDKIHTKLIFDMARDIGLNYTPDSSWVDLYCNGQYQGLYLLTESVTSNLDRFNGILIEKSNKNQIDTDEISFSTNLEYLFKLKKPEYITQSQTNDLADYIQEIETFITTGDSQYAECVDIISLAKQFLIDKIVLEGDAMSLSTFFYIKDEKLYAGPLWDYDRAMGERFPDYETPIEGPPNGMAEWYMALYNDEEFFAAMQDAYRELLPYCRQILQNDIDKYVEEISASVAMDSILMAKYVTPSGMSDLQSYTEYESYIKYLKFFLASRLNYLNGLWGISDWAFEVPASTGEYHTVKFQLPDGMVVDTMEIKDGECIKELPPPDEKTYTEWSFLCREGGYNKPYFSKIPIYENITLYANYVQ